MKKISILVFALLLLTRCSQEDIIAGALPGVWNMVEYERTQINQDGSTEQILYEENAGRWEFQDTDLGLYYYFYYTGSQGSQSDNGYIEVGEGGQRLIIYGGICTGCDKAFTVESFSASQMTLTTYSPQNNGTLTYKLKMVLQKQ